MPKGNIRSSVKEDYLIKEFNMKKLLMYIFSAFVVFCISFSACSRGEDVEHEKGEIEKFTDQIADDALQGIKAPINKARAVQDIADKRVKALDNPTSDE